jgi:prepilin signal peptidase PulO-like enzyme (type II secretory pathway)
MIELFLIFTFGLIIGSFLNCVIWRLYKEESFLSDKSYCPHCRHPLGTSDLVPVLSYIFLRGKCRYCQKKISIQYPLVELITALLFVFVYLRFGPVNVLFSFNFFEVLFWWIISAFLILIFVFDLKYYIIPDEVIYPAIIVSMLWILYSFSFGAISKTDVLYTVISSLSASLFFFLIWFFSKGMAMGFGDVKLALLMGLMLGYPNIVAGLFLGFLFGAIIGSGLVLLKKKGFKSEIPFGPFLLAGLILSLFYGERIINWYLSLSF